LGLGQTLQNWVVLELDRERPDFLVRDPAGKTWGIEISEVMAPEQGEARSMENRLCSAIRVEVMRALERHGGKGATVFGFNETVPSPGRCLDGFSRSLSAHLRLHDAPLWQDRGMISAEFNHEWGVVLNVIRDDRRDGVRLIGQAQGAPPESKQQVAESEIERRIVERVEDKVRKAHGYERSHGLWLLLINRAQGIGQISDGCRLLVQGLNGSAFARISLCNLPFGEMDARPRYPRLLRLL